MIEMSRLPDRFWAKVDCSAGPDSCWPWLASTKGDGHGGGGQYSIAGAILLAHRVSYEAFVGPLQNGRMVRHLCGTASCVNPAHLEAVPELFDRIFSKVDASGDCWEWTAAKGQGYGRFQMSGRDNQPAHRVVYEFLVGPVPAGLLLDHLCRNRGCVNPDHMEPVTHVENVRRGYGIASIHRRRDTCPQGHPYDLLSKNGKGIIARRCQRCVTASRRRYKARRAAA